MLTLRRWTVIKPDPRPHPRAPRPTTLGSPRGGPAFRFVRFVYPRVRVKLAKHKIEDRDVCLRGWKVYFRHPWKQYQNPQGGALVGSKSHPPSPGSRDAHVT